MSKDEDSGYIWPLNKEAKKAADQTAALLGLSNSGHAIGGGLEIVLAHAKAHAIGKTEIFFCAPKLAEVLNNNPEFIDALCEEGVVEWLTPFVLTKSKQSTTDTGQP
jgi:hypothetical protein